MDEMTEKQEEATRIIEAIGTTTDNQQGNGVLPCVSNRYLIEYKNEWGANRQTYIEAINSEEARKIFYETYQSATICYTQVL